MTLTSAPERVCREVLTEAPSDPVAVVLARHHAQANTSFSGHVDFLDDLGEVRVELFLADAAASVKLSRERFRSVRY